MITVRHPCYPVKSSNIRGFYVTPPTDHLRMGNIINKWKKRIASKGYEEYSFPSAGLRYHLGLEKDHLKIGAEVYNLTDQTYLAPTGEMIMYPLILDDPRRKTFRWHQVSRVYRNQSDSCAYLRRHKEIKYFYELHALLPTVKEAMSELKYLEKAADRFLNEIGLPTRKHTRTADDRFPGAQSTLAYDTVLTEGKVVQVLTLHYLGSTFSKSLGRDSGYMLCLGFSERLLGALRDLYGENLRDWDNPFPVITIDRKGRATFKQLADSAQAYYENAYTKSSKGYRHYLTGCLVPAQSWKSFVKDRSTMVRAIVEEKARSLLETHIVPRQKNHRLGYCKLTGNLMYCDRKV